MSKSKNEDVTNKRKKKQREITDEEELQLERLADFVLNFMFNHYNKNDELDRKV